MLFGLKDAFDKKKQVIYNVAMGHARCYFSNTTKKTVVLRI